MPETPLDDKPAEASSTSESAKVDSQPTNLELAALVDGVLKEKLGSSEQEGSNSEQEQTEETVKEEKQEEQDEQEEKSEEEQEEKTDSEKEEVEGEEKVEQEAESKPNPDEKLPFNKHPRFQELIKESRELKAVRVQVEQEKPFVESAKALSDFCSKNKIADSDLREALTLVALGKTDLKAFRVKLGEILTDLDITTGERLPVDLQKKVDDALIDEDSAKELARLRLQNKTAQQTGQSYEQQLLEQRRQLIVSAINSWEQQQLKNPDYGKLKAVIAKFFQADCASSYPQTSSEAVVLLDKALKDAKEQVKQFLPKPVSRKPVKLNGSLTPAEEQDSDFDSFDSKTVLKFIKSKLAARR